ncbi:unnamed protein product [Vicia faba]|uniref:BSD domain-containing protein n=1 Tax=Vicia faba TaxID=3906 RepID=A0AAV0YGA0_VICFA|nr:unnamed protein product [Vicia faba]
MSQLRYVLCPRHLKDNQFWTIYFALARSHLAPKALSSKVDRNKQFNLTICLMQMNKIPEARFLIHAVTASTKNRKMDDSFVKSYERATQMLPEMKSTSIMEFCNIFIMFSTIEQVYIDLVGRQGES